MTIEDAWARFDDLRSGTAWVFGSAEHEVAAHSLDEVRDLVDTADRLTRDGAWAWGFVGYDASPAFDPAYRVTGSRADAAPLAYFAFGGEPATEPCIELSPQATLLETNAGQLDWDASEHKRRVMQLQTAIAAGDLYQANLTTQSTVDVRDDLLDLYAGLAHAQRGAFNALLNLDRHVILSVSPELFFRWDNDGITVRPMKGTARRGSTSDEDARARLDLLRSEKERAENVMIVDLLRNDLSRVAQTGSVRVQSLLDAERYETVWQLTSTITCKPRPATNLLDVFDALFPCGSVTGAPKVAAMNQIALLESRPRELYTGAIGMIAPPGTVFRANFSVAIRTLAFDQTRNVATYGVGSAITWDSQPDHEYDELLAKTEVLNETGDFKIVETLRFEPAEGLHNLDRHLRRMLNSARYFGFTVDPKQIGRTITDVVANLPTTAALRVRLLLNRAGLLVVEHTAAPLASGSVDVACDTSVTVPSRWTKHKTTRRDPYDAAARRVPNVDEVILVNQSGHVMETNRSNVALHIAGCWYTPPVSSGCLAGVGRQIALDAGTLRERVITVDDLKSCEDVAVVNSLRGWRAARLRPSNAVRTSSHPT